ncbi:MAG: Gfo/Idh/MocA family oxidoreductase [Bdellovibrionales bacterium]|nr:Gfo/Idh/MocA family oxidoreductase [Bdellovibrionales bacterium]
MMTPYILGKGRAGQAIEKSLAMLAIQNPGLRLQPAIGLERGVDLHAVKRTGGKSILCIANPHALHTQAIIDAETAGFNAVLCEKPACVNPEQLKKIRAVRIPVAICHGYRMSWGIQHIRSMIERKELGDVIAIESRYWQSSSAARALEPSSSKTWKDDKALAGEYDTLLDLGTHFIDAAAYLMGSKPVSIEGVRSFANAESPHRDTHLNLVVRFPQGRALGSVSKTVHGATNQFEMNVLGTGGAASWNFLSPDEIVVGAGRDRRIVTRKDAQLGSQQSPFHGLGWLEGYVEIASRLTEELQSGTSRDYPKLQEHLDLLERLFQTRWDSFY